LDFDLICDNKTWATTRTFTTFDRHGYDVVVIVARLAYYVPPPATPASAGRMGRMRLVYRPVRMMQTPQIGGGIQFADDLADEKPGTDVGMLGTAHPPRGGRDSFLAWLAVGGTLRKVVRVYGPRVFVAEGSAVVPGAPGKPEATPLRYDYCWGESVEPYNPIGRGLDDVKLLVGKAAPQLEVEAEGTVNRPRRSHAAFGPLDPSWEPRRRLAGTFDMEWRRKRAPFRPRDFDLAHHNWACPDLHSDVALEPDVPIEVGGVRPEGVWRFKLPKYPIEFTSRMNGDYSEHKSHLDSLLIDADEAVIELTYRVSIRLPKKWERLERLFVRSPALMPDDVLPAPEGAAPDAPPATA
jgi:hypothetical protein